MTHAAMEGDKRPAVRRPDVLRKLNTESLLMIERGLLGDLPERLKPQPFVPRGRSPDTRLDVARPAGFLSSCIPMPDSPGNRTPSSDDEGVSPLKKSFSFRDKFSRISLFGKDKDKPKCKTIEENEKLTRPSTELKRESKAEYDYRNHKRFWFFRNKELEKTKGHSPIYQRSKSFEFLPRAIQEEEEEPENRRKAFNRQSSAFESDSMGDAWTSNESLEYISNVYYDTEEGVQLKSIREFPSESSGAGSSVSAATSASGANAENIFRRGSVQDLIDEFNRAVDMFGETYLSDCEPYTRSEKQLPLEEKRKSNSFSSLPSPKVLQVNKVSEVSEDFKRELSQAVAGARAAGPGRPRRGSVTDWFVLEVDPVAGSPPVRPPAPARPAAADQNKYRRGKKKSMNRVRRMSSTKYWITAEECAVYSREQRPPLVIPRITPYRAARRNHHPYPEEAPLKSSMREYGRLDYSPVSARADLERSFSKAGSDSPPLGHLSKKFSGSSENILGVSRRPQHLQLPASSSGDSLDIEMRAELANPRHGRKSQSVHVAHRHRLQRSPVPAPRAHLPPPPPRHLPEASQHFPVIHEGAVKRTKYIENGKKSKKNWTECYMILTPTALMFFKDQKTYQAFRQSKPGTPPSPSGPRLEVVLPLHYARVLPCKPAHTRRHNKSLWLTVDYDEYLIQDESEKGSEKWLHEIQKVIYKLYPLMINMEHPALHAQSSNTDLESLGRTPPAARHANSRNKQKAGGSSNEDLSDSTENSIPKSHVKRRLRDFFARRPAMEVLIRRGVYKDEPVFGRNLEEVCAGGGAGARVPEFVVACVNEIESSEENLCTDGLYRASGNLSQVQKLRLEIDQTSKNHVEVIRNNTDIHVLTGSLKLFFRELKEPLIPCSMFDRILAACSLKPKEVKIKEFRDIVNSLPACNRDTLKYLLEHLLRVTKYSERNRMHTANLAIVFGPTLLWAPAAQAHNIAVDCIQQNNVVDILLNDFHDIFDDGRANKKA